MDQIEQTKPTSKAADEQLKAYMAYIQGPESSEDGVKFSNLKKDQERKLKTSNRRGNLLPRHDSRER